MQVSVEPRDGLEVSLKVEIPGDQVTSEVNAQLLRLSKSVTLPGFRPGKVPMKMIKKEYSAKVHHDVGNKIVDNTLQNAINESKIHAAGILQLLPGEIRENEPFTYEAIIEVFPEFELKDLSGVELEKMVCDISEKDIDTMLENLRKQQTDWQDTDRAAANEDKIKVDFEGSLNGEPLPQATAQGFELDLGSNSMIPGFEEAFVGMKPGEEKTVDLKFPDDYHAKDMAAQTVQFKLTLHNVQEPKLPALDDEFAKGVKAEANTLVELRTELEKSMRRELEERLKNAAKQTVFEKLIEVNDVPAPKSLVQEETQRLLKQMLSQFNLPKEQLDKIALPTERFQEQAERNIKLQLILSEYIKKNEIKATDEEVHAFVEHIAESYEEKQNMMDYYLHNQQRLQQVHAVVTEDNAVERLWADAKVKEVSQSYEDIMRADQQQ